MILSLFTGAKVGLGSGLICSENNKTEAFVFPWHTTCFHQYFIITITKK